MWSQLVVVLLLAVLLTYLLTAVLIVVVYVRLGLAIVPLCLGTGAPLRRTQAPLASSKFFDNNGNNFSWPSALSVII